MQVFRLDTAMMRSLDPSFQIAENEMDHGQVRLGFVGVAAERQRLMTVSHLRKAGVASPAIGAQRGAHRNVVFDKADKRIGATIGHHAKPQSSCINAASVLLAVIRTRPNLYSADHDRLVMDPATFAARLAADHAFVDLDGILTANGVALWADHASAELVEYLKGSLITREPKLALELNGALARVCVVMRYAPQNHVESGVWLDCMTVPAVSDVLALHPRHRNTTDERVAKR